MRRSAGMIDVRRRVRGEKRWCGGSILPSGVMPARWQPIGDDSSSWYPPPPPRALAGPTTPSPPRGPAGGSGTRSAVHIDEARASTTPSGTLTEVRTISRGLRSIIEPNHHHIMPKAAATHGHLSHSTPAHTRTRGAVAPNTVAEGASVRLANACRAAAPAAAVLAIIFGTVPSRINRNF